MKNMSFLFFILRLILKKKFKNNIYKMISYCNNLLFLKLGLKKNQRKTKYNRLNKYIIIN